MGCCEATNLSLTGSVSRGGRSTSWDWSTTDAQLSRRDALRGILAAAGVLWVSSCSSDSSGQGAPVRLAFCGQLLCVIPYEVARARGHFADQGFDMELVYTRGGNAAMQALVGGAVDYAGTSFDVALQAAANGAEIRRVLSTGRLPLFALAASPARADEVTDVPALQGLTVGISALGNADHALLLYLLDQAGVDPASVRFAAIGTNLFDALRLGQVDAAMLQEPALSLILESGGRTIVNFMDLEETSARFGGAYEFMGVSIRAVEREERLPEIGRLAAALAAGLADARTLPPEEIIAALPEPLIAGGDEEQLRRIIEEHRLSLYPEDIRIDPDAAGRVLSAHEVAGLLEVGRVDLGELLDTAATGT